MSRDDCSKLETVSTMYQAFEHLLTFGFVNTNANACVNACLNACHSVQQLSTLVPFRLTLWFSLPGTSQSWLLLLLRRGFKMPILNPRRSKAKPARTFTAAINITAIMMKQSRLLACDLCGPLHVRSKVVYVGAYLLYDNLLNAVCYMQPDFQVQLTSKQTAACRHAATQ